ncbi:MAG: TolB family protein, partial [bacterium]
MFMFLMWRKLRWGSVLAAVLFSVQGLVWHSVYGQQAESQGGDTVQSASDSAGQVEWGKVLNLGRTINSTLSEYRPRVSTDGKTLYLCRKVADPSARLKFYRLLGVNYGDFMRMSQAARERKITQRITSMEPSELLELLTLLGEVDGHEDIYVSQLDSIEWSPARSAGYPLSTAVSNEGPESISTDNNQMFVFKDGDIYLTHRFGDRWSSLTKVEEPINSSAWDADICFSADGRTLFFASRRPGFTTSWSETGKNIDIWVTVKNDSGWGEPVNLGPTINTTKTDRTPFLHADGRTLYFASDGNGGQGGMDLFKTTRLSDSSWTAWSEPINLTPLNSPSDDWDLSMPANSEWAYFASARDGGLGLYDIYKYR